MNGGILKRLRLATLTLNLCLVGAFAAMADSSWQIVKVDGRDYLTLQHIAQFYELTPQQVSVTNPLVLGDGRARLVVGTNPIGIEINGVRQYLSFPILYRDGQTLISRFDLAKTIEPSLRPTMIGNLQPFHTVVLDAGHGGGDRGANSSIGFEKDYTLDVIRDLRKALERRGFRVLTTRESDVYMTLQDRAARANDIPDSVFVSVHFNSSPTGAGANGLEVFAMSPEGAPSTGDKAVSIEQFQKLPGNDFDNASLAMATCVHHSLLGHLPGADRGVKRARFVVLKLTHSPAILVEGGFLTNPTDSGAIDNAAWREKLADAIAQGVQSYQDLAVRKVPPKLLADYRSEQLPLTGTIVNPAALASSPPTSATSAQPVSNPGSGLHPSPAPVTGGSVPAQAGAVH